MDSRGRALKKYIRKKKDLGFVLLPFGQLDKSVIAQKIACDFLSDLRFFFSRKKGQEIGGNNEGPDRRLGPRKLHAIFGGPISARLSSPGPFSFRKRTGFSRLLRSRGKYRRGKETNVQIRRIWTFAKKKNIHVEETLVFFYSRKEKSSFV